MKLTDLHEGKVKNAAIDREFDRSQKPASFGVLINGKLWKREGKAVPFTDRAAALKAADKITATKNITTQVVQL